MKTKLFCLAVAATALPAWAVPPVIISGRASSDATSLILDLYAETSVELRTFGLAVGFDSALISPLNVSVDDGQWFLGTGPASHLNYTTSSTSSASIRLTGARFSTAVPGAGLPPGKSLLASLTFKRTSASLPAGFDISLAGPAGYASFVGTDGINYDSKVEGLQKAFTLTFSPLPVDRDRDGLPDGFEQEMFGNLTTSNGSGDTDGDGVSDVEEWIAGTHPGKPGSVARLNLSRSPGATHLTWSGQPGRTYRILWSKDLDGFTPVTEAVPAAEANEVIHTAAGRSGFYRLSIENPAGGR